MIERAVLLADNNSKINAADLRNGCLQELQGDDHDAAHALSHRQSLGQFEAKRLADALRQCDYNRTKTAEMLGISRRSVQEKIARYGLDSLNK